MSLRSILSGRVTKKTARRDAAHTATKDGAPSHDRERLDDVGLVAALATDLSLRDVTQALRHSRENMFDPLPSRGSGMSSYPHH